MLAKTNPRLPESARAGPAHPGLAQRVFAAFQQGRWQEVERLCAQLDAQTLHGSVNLQQVLGMSLWHQGRAHEALPCLDRALALRDDIADLHSNRAVVLEDLGQLDQALSGYNTALQLAPASASIWSNRGTFFKRLGRWPQALHDLQRACVLAPDQAQYHYNYAVVLQALGELPSAQAHLREAMRLQPNHPEAPWNLALCALLQGDWQQGWPLHEARWRKRGESLSQPLRTPSALTTSCSRPRPSPHAPCPRASK